MTATDHMHKAVVVQAVSLAVIFLVVCHLIVGHYLREIENNLRMLFENEDPN